MQGQIPSVQTDGSVAESGEARETIGRRPSPLENGLVPLALSLIPFSFLLFLLTKYALDFPFWDEWVGFIPFLEKSYQGSLSLVDLWTQHNEHRLFFPNLIMLSLARVSGWNHSYQIAASVLFGVGIFGVLYWQLKKTDEVLGTRRASWLLPVLPLVVFSVSQWENWSWGWQMLEFLNVFAVVSAFTLLAHPVFTWWRFSAGILLGIVANYSRGNSVLFWPIAFFILCLVVSDKRTRQYAVMLLVLVGALTLATYLYDYHQPAYHPSVWSVLVDPIGYVKYVLAYLGSPIVCFKPYLAILMGFLGLCVFGLASAFCLRARYVPVHAAMSWISLGLYAILSAVLTGLGRIGFGWIQAMSSRYITISSLLWVGNFALLYILATRAPVGRSMILRRKGDMRKSLQGVLASLIVAGFSLLLLWTPLDAVRIWRERYEYLLPARAELFLAEDDAMLQRLFSSADVVREGTAVLRRYELSAFRVQ